MQRKISFILVGLLVMMAMATPILAKENKMEKGDIVRVIDASWSLIAGDGKLYHPNIKNNSRELWEILATNCKLPISDYSKLLKKGEFNNTILRSLDSNRILFTQARFLTLAHHCHVCPYCGEKFKTVKS